MKKMVFGLSLVLVTLGFFVSPVLAETNLVQEAPALNAFLSSLTVPVAPALAAKPAASGAEALCNATANCGSGTVSCSGNNSTTSCTAVDRNCGAGQQGRVTCDGVTTLCPTPCPCPSDFCTIARQNCQDSCYPCRITFSCNLAACTDNCQCRWSTCPI